MKILIVEDEIVSREKLKAIVSRFGDCETAETANTALEMFAKSLKDKNYFDLVFLDIILPDMKGNEILVQMRQMEKDRDILKKTKIVMVTSCAYKEFVIDCKVNGCDDYIVKPFDKEVVINKVTALGFQ